MGKFRIAVATKGRGGLEDIVSEVFGRANTFTIADVDDDQIKDVKVLQNPAVSYKHGAGPIVVKMLVDSSIDVVLAAELGPGASSLLEQHNITRVTAKPGNSVNKTIRNALVKIGK